MKETKRLSLYDWEERYDYYKPGSNVYNALRFIDDYRSIGEDAAELINSTAGLGECSFSIDGSALEDKRVRLENFCGGIYEEMMLEVDEPFAKAMGRLMDDLYEISPEVIKEDKKICGFIPVGKSLADLLSTVVPSEDLKNALKQKIEGLKEDEPQWSYGEALVAAYGKYFRSVKPVEVETAIKERFITEYEALNKDECKKYSKFLKCMNNETYYEDMVNIKVLTYSSEYAELLMRYTDRYKITDIEYGDDPGEEKDGGVFSPGIVNTLVLTLADEKENPRGAYYTYFHEMGHAIDYFYGWDSGCFNYFSSKYTDASGQTLLDYNRLDYKNSLDKTIAQLKLKYPDYAEADWNDVESNLLNYNRDYASLTDEQQEIEEKLRLVYTSDPKGTGILDGANNNSASDIFGGLSNNALKGAWGHTTDSQGKPYWIYENGKIRNNTNMESFAEYFARTILSNPERDAGINSQSKFLPNSTKMIDEILENMKVTYYE